jgi:hypothetical protein
MAIDSNRLLGHVFPEIRHEYVDRDAILYALGIGLGADRLDATNLNFLLEKRLNLLPTLAVTLASSAVGTRAHVGHRFRPRGPFRAVHCLRSPAGRLLAAWTGQMR